MITLIINLFVLLLYCYPYHIIVIYVLIHTIT